MTEYHGQVEAIVWTMPGMEFIVGLPDIAKNFVDLLTSMLRASDDVVGNVLETDMRPGDIRLWSKGEVEESPEESETPHQCTQNRGYPRWVIHGTVIIHG